MPYVPVPKDLTEVKTKVAFNLTKRQLICFGGAAAVGVPAYFLTRGIFGTTGAVMVLRAPGCRGEARRFGRPASLRGPVRQHQNSVIRPSAMPAAGDSKEIQGRLPMEAGGGNGRSVATWQKDLAAGASPAWAAA